MDKQTENRTDSQKETTFLTPEKLLENLKQMEGQPMILTIPLTEGEQHA